MDKPAESKEKAVSAADEAAKKTVDDTKKHLADHAGGDTHGAYNKLIDSVRITHAELDKKDPTGKTSKAYEQKVVAELEREKVLPIFALEYGQRAFGKIDNKNAETGKGDGRVTAAELQAFKLDGKAGVFGNAMVDSLTKNADSIRTVGPRGSGGAGFSEADLATGVIKHERGVEFQKSNQEKEVQTKAAQGEAKDLQSYLFDKKDGKASLFERADFDGAGSLVDRTDKKVGKQDFVALANDPTLSEAEKKELKEKVIDKWDDPAFQKAYVSNGFMTEDTFKKATGEVAAEQEKAKTEVATEKTKAQAEKDKAAEAAALEVKKEATDLNSLLGKNIDGSTVLKQADFLGSTKESERTDGKVSKQDLEALVKSPGIDPALGKEIQEKIIAKMDDSAFQKRYMTGGYIDSTKIVKEANSVATGFDKDYDQKEREQGKAAKTAQEQAKIEADAKAIAAERAKSAELAAALFKEDGGVSLLKRADYVGSSNLKDRTDGKINDKDLAALAADPSLSQETKDFINNNLIAKWKTPEVMRLQQGGYISAESLKALLPNS